MPDEIDQTQGGQETSQGGDTSTTGSATIDWSKVSIPEDVLKASPLYKELLQESIIRRQKIAELKEALESDVKKTEEKPKTNEVSDEVPAWAKGLVDTIKQLENELGASKRTAFVQSAIAEFKLSPDVADLINGNTPEEIKASAKRLSELVKTYPNIGATNPANSVDDSKDMLKRVWSHMSGEGQANPFDTGLQSQLGGGAFRINK